MATVGTERGFDSHRLQCKSAVLPLLCDAFARLTELLSLAVPTRYYAHPVASKREASGNARKRREVSAGKLELTWTNKDKALLSHEDGSYEWVPKRDRRVAEVRLLHEAGTVGGVAAVGPRVRDNLLIRGDSLHALVALTKLPEFARELEGKVKLCYLDPPFNTGETFEHYDDGLEHSVWLTLMRDRLVEIKKLLAPDGSVWVHCDDSEQAHLRVLMDELFGREKFLATIVWQKRYSRENRKAIGTVHDYIHVYAPMGTEWKHVRNKVTRTAAKEYRNPNKDPKGPWRPIPLDAQAGHATEAQFYEVATPGGAVHSPPPGRAWSLTKARMDELIDQGKVYFGRNGRGKPNLIRYLTESEGLVAWTWWPHEEVGNNDESKKELLALFPEVEPFDTPKPERLMKRIIEIATDPGDLVLDCFAGSGTTAAVAHKMGRRWVTAEAKRETIDTFTAPRLQRVLKGEVPGGVTGITDWKGGGGFRVLDIAPSMYKDDAGVIVLAEWAVNGQLAEAVAAQLGFAFEPDGVFAGRKGRMRIAVVDGHAHAELAKTFLELLGSNERLTLCATSLDPEVGEVLRQERPGSRVRVVPEDLLLAYATASPWRVSVANSLEVGEATPETSNGQSKQTTTEPTA